jgi:cystathionine beta-lyase/cystathionine gamma-synthase
MRIETRAIHAGDRKKAPPAVPVTTPIYTAASYFYDDMEQLDRVFGRTEQGFSYSRYDNPSNHALEELAASIESGHGALACASGMAAIQIAIATALEGRPKRILASYALYGATISVLHKVFEPLGVEVEFADMCELDAVKPCGCVLMETMSNPLLRVPPIDRIAGMARKAGAAVIVDNTFATPLLVRPMELGASMVVESATKYLAGHGDVLAGLVISDDAHYDTLRMLSRAYGPVLGPFECYLTMRGIKTFPLRMERHCANACRVAEWLKQHPRVERVYYPGDPQHPDAAAIERLFAPGLRGGMVSFEIKGAGREEVFRMMERLELIVPATSLGDVHTMMLYPIMSSHREVPPAERDRMGIRENLVRLSVGIEAAEDILADLGRALENR